MIASNGYRKTAPLLVLTTSSGTPALLARFFRQACEHWDKLPSSSNPHTAIYAAETNGFRIESFFLIQSQGSRWPAYPDIQKESDHWQPVRALAVRTVKL
jgi:hypothetical protein